MSSSNESPAAEERIRRIRKQCPRFRILIIGRANAGKTTILQRVCKTMEDPEIFTPQGEKVCLLLKELEATKNHTIQQSRLRSPSLNHPLTSFVSIHPIRPLQADCTLVFSVENMISRMRWFFAATLGLFSMTLVALNLEMSLSWRL
jgi:GTPase SAR1 family protein